MFIWNAHENISHQKKKEKRNNNTIGTKRWLSHPNTLLYVECWQEEDKIDPKCNTNARYKAHLHLFLRRFFLYRDCENGGTWYYVRVPLPTAMITEKMRLLLCFHLCQVRKISNTTMTRLLKHQTEIRFIIFFSFLLFWLWFFLFRSFFVGNSQKYNDKRAHNQLVWLLLFLSNLIYLNKLLTFMHTCLCDCLLLFFFFRM